MSNITDTWIVMNPPDDEWLTRLRRGHVAWAVKEERFVKIEFAYEPPEPGMLTGRIGLRFCWSDGDQWGSSPECYSWFIDAAGQGIDGKPLLLPVAGHCPDEPTPISEPWQRHVERTLGKLIHRIEQLEAATVRSGPWG